MPPYVGTLGEDEVVAAAQRQVIIVRRQEAANVGEPVLLCGEGRAVREREHVPSDLSGRPVTLPGLPEADEPGVLREAARVKVVGKMVALADRADGTEV
jgi:hypothetical protein